MADLLCSTGVEVVVLDPQLRLLSFTPLAGQLLNLRPDDMGRPVAPSSDGGTRTFLLADARAALRNERVPPRELPGEDGRWFRTSATLYRSEEKEPAAVIFTLLDITAEKALRQAEEKERIRQEQFEMLLNQTPVGICLVDADLRVAQINPIARRAFGDIPGGLVGRDLGELLAHKWARPFAEEVISIFRRTLETGAPFHEVERGEKRADRGTRELYDWRLERIPLPQGGHGVACYFREVSDQVQTREAAAASEERYRALFNSIDDGFCVIEMLFDEGGKPVDYRFVEVNAVWEKHTGLHDPIGRTAREMVPSLEDHWVETYGQVALTGKPLRFINHAPSMEERWFDVYAFREPRGKDARVVLLFRDITDRRRLEESLRQSEAQFRTIADHLPLIVWMHDAEGGQEFVNRTFGEFFGVTREEMRGGKWKILMHPDDALAYAEQFLACLREHREFHAEVRVQDGTGRWRWLESWGCPRFSSSGDFLGFIGTSADVTDRKETEARLRENHLFYRQTLESIPGMVFTTLADGYCDYQSQQWVDFTGIPLSEQVGNGWNKLLHPEDQSRAMEAWRAAVEGRAPYDLQYRVRRHDGLYEWFRVVGRPIRDTDGKIARWFGVAVNIQALMEAEADLAQSRERLQAALDGSGAGTYRWSIPDNQVEWDDNLDKLFGLQPGETVRTVEAFLARVHPQDRELVAGKVVRTEDGGLEKETEFRVVWPNGDIRWLYGKGKIFRDAEGHPAYEAGACIDITRRKETDEALRKSESRFRAMANLVPDLLWRSGTDGAATWFNQRWLHYTGKKWKESLGYRWLEVIHPEERETFGRSYEKAVKNNHGLQHEQRFRGSDGSYRWFLIRIEPVRDDTGHVQQWFGAATDIHDQKTALAQLEEKVAQRTHEVRELASRLTLTEQKERKRIAEVLHDGLQQTLAAIHMKLGVMHRTSIEAGSRELAAHAEQAMEWNGQAIAATRQLAVDLCPPALRSTESMAEAFHWLQVQMEHRHGLRVDLQVGDDSCIPAESIRLLLFQIVRELLFNITKHAQTDHAIVSIAPAGSACVVTVEDQGVGFDPGQLDTPGRAEGGFGLSSIRERIILVGGETRIESAPGKGTRIIITIPQS